jgi:hypothetical protein
MNRPVVYVSVKDGVADWVIAQGDPESVDVVLIDWDLWEGLTYVHPDEVADTIRMAINLIGTHEQSAVRDLIAKIEKMDEQGVWDDAEEVLVQGYVNTVKEALR